MQFESGGIRYTPSDLAVFHDSEFASWMDRWDLERRRGASGPLPLLATPLVAAADPDLPLFAAPAPAGDCTPDAEDEDARMLRQHGERHELQVFESFVAGGLSVVDLGSDQSGERTAAAIASRAPVLYQPLLRDGEFSGRPDFLVYRAEDEAYEPLEAKLARSAKPEHVIQICAYAALVERATGRLPASFTLALGDGRRERLPLDRYFHHWIFVRRAFLDFQRRFDPARMPHPGHSSRYGRWSGCAARIIEATDHLRSVAFIRASQIRKLERAGVTTVAELATLEAGRARATRLRPETLTGLTAQARLQVRSRDLERPAYEHRPVPAGDEGEPCRRGLALLPPPSPRDVFFDMEGHPLPEGQLEYLFGAVHEDGGRVRFQDWWGLDRAAEHEAFLGFVDWVHARWRADPAMHVYHYNSYETAALKRLMGTYGAREDEIDDLLRHEVFVDLYRVVREGLVIGAGGYSLKDIEPLYRTERGGRVQTAEGCMAAFDRWLDAPDGRSWQDSAVLRDIREYNRADCESTRDLAAWLRRVQEEAGIVFVPGGTAASPDGETAPTSRQAQERAQAHDLAARLLGMAGAATDPEEKRLAALLAALVEFHWREEKPAYWRHFERLAMSEEELYDDLESLAGCERVRSEPLRVGNESVFEYSFDPEQDTKLGSGDACALAGAQRGRARIKTLDPETGRVLLRLGAGIVAAPARLSLVPEGVVNSSPLRRAVVRYAAAWSEGRVESRAIDDFLARRAPRILGRRGGPIRPAGVDAVEALSAAVAGLDESALCVQGPPGTGKTWGASHAIYGLLRAGRRVGVTANSHKAILNLMHAVVDRAREAKSAIEAIKVGGTLEDVQREEIRHLAESSDAESALRAAGGGVVLGGTAWCFARPELAGAFDTLFVDEAGQVSLANLVAAAQAARNLVLVGDQMQLAQPIQGSHPGESGRSALEYLLQDHATIPPDFGIFLDRTHRMHPEVCAFVSEAVYEGRLGAAAATARRRILLPERRPQALLQRGTGIVWLPVEHRDNAQASEEEAEVVERVVAELLAARFRDEKGNERRLELDDILLVAPYNMQVRWVQRRLAARFGSPGRVGSVDRFQGQEAPAVVLSMCASSAEDVPRGLEFLLSPNRINVAVSRAQCLAVVVGSPALLATRARALPDMERLALFGRLVLHAEDIAAGGGG